MLRSITSRAAFVVLIAGSVLALGPAGTAEAAKHKRCVKYANNAVWQHKRNLNYGCAYRGPRWHFGWRLHYHWCRRAAPWRVRQERQIRRHRLWNCGAL